MHETVEYGQEPADHAGDLRRRRPVGQAWSRLPARRYAAELIGRWRQLSAPLRDGVFAAVLGAIAFAPGIAPDGVLLGELPVRQLDVLGVVAGLGQCLPLAVRRRYPAVCLAVITGFFCVGQLRGYPSNFGSVGILVALYSVGAHLDRRREAVAVAASGIYVVLCVALFGLHSPERPVDYVTFYLVMAACWAAGSWVRARQQAQDARRRLEAAAAVASDRARIARELHDVVTHHVTTMVIQADAAQFLVPQSPERVTENLGAIGTTGRRALAELRFLLGVLSGPGDAEAIGSSLVDARRIGELVEQTRQAGQPVEFTEEGDPRPNAGGAELTAYRIVQESLTNALKHAPGRATCVSVRHAADAITIDVTTEGPRHGTGGSNAGVSGLAESGSGRGLIGLRERAAVFGGEVHADKLHDGGFAVRARLPLEDIA